MSVNGELRQDSNTDLMVHSVDDLIDTLASWYGASPGDYLWTGTPVGVGKMESGDLIECKMENTTGLTVSKMIGKCVI